MQLHLPAEVGALVHLPIVPVLVQHNTLVADVPGVVLPIWILLFTVSKALDDGNLPIPTRPPRETVNKLVA